MPLQIVHRNIVDMSCDAIVNPSNTMLEPGGGVDLAIHTAAGPELLAYCRELGGCEVGKAKISPAFKLSCKHVIHTVGPHWGDGPLSALWLSDCYTHCLELAVAHGCKSIAFPLISAGTHGFPKDQVMQIALKTIGDFLLQQDMMVYLVIYDRGSYDLEQRLGARLRKYIDDRYSYECNYLMESSLREPEPSIRSSRSRRSRTESAAFEKSASVCCAPCVAYSSEE